jgi:hypothetical protein
MLRFKSADLSQRIRVVAFCGVAVALSGCATGGVNSSVFVDPSRYDLYDCQQLITARVVVDKRVVELQGLMAKADTGFAGPVMSGLAYNVDYNAAVAQRDLIDQKYAANNCAAEIRPAPSTAAPPAAPKGRTKR